MTNATPTVRDLRRVYTHRPFSVFAVSRQTKMPGERVRYSTIHSAMIFPLSGQARLILGDDSLLGSRGRVLHGCPNRPLVFEALGDEPFEHINVYYEAGEDDGSDPDGWMGRPWTFDPPAYEALLARVEALEALNRVPSLENRLNQIVGTTGLLKSMFSTSARHQVNERVARVRVYLETHYREPVRLGDLAEMVGMSEQRLSYAFDRAYGVRPMNFLIMRRLEEAHRLLEEGALVKDAADAAGYDDALYFSRLFKKHYGCPPASVRRG